MTYDELAEAVTALRAEVATLSIEVTRGKAMIQELSESHDQNRRELQEATKRARDLGDLHERQVSNSADLFAQVKELRAREARG